MPRLGFYVEGKYFAGKLHQAVAFATFRAKEYGRSVDVTFVNQNEQLERFKTITPTKEEIIAAERAA